MTQPGFLIDSNCLINPHNDYYRPDFRLSRHFWERLKGLVVSGDVGILSHVVNEVSAGGQSGDHLDGWLQSVRLKTINADRDPLIVSKFGEVMQFVADQRVFSQHARQSWMRDGVADPWLVAAAAVYGSRIITFEKFVTLTPNQPASGAKIPNVARQFDVQCVSLFDFMAEAGGF